MQVSKEPNNCLVMVTLVKVFCDQFRSIATAAAAAHPSHSHIASTWTGQSCLNAERRTRYSQRTWRNAEGSEVLDAVGIDLSGPS